MKTNRASIVWRLGWERAFDARCTAALCVGNGIGLTSLAISSDLALLTSVCTGVIMIGEQNRTRLFHRKMDRADGKGVRIAARDGRARLLRGHTLGTFRLWKDMSTEYSIKGELAGTYAASVTPSLAVFAIVPPFPW